MMIYDDNGILQVSLRVSLGTGSCITLSDLISGLNGQIYMEKSQPN